MSRRPSAQQSVCFWRIPLERSPLLGVSSPGGHLVCRRYAYLDGAGHVYAPSDGLVDRSNDRDGADLGGGFPGAGGLGGGGAMMRCVIVFGDGRRLRHRFAA